LHAQNIQMKMKTKNSNGCLQRKFRFNHILSIYYRFYKIYFVVGIYFDVNEVLTLFLLKENGVVITKE
jgi:hypothetical protein